MLSESHQEDIQLATRIRDQRCEESFNRLFEKYQQSVQRHCYKRLLTIEDAEDATMIAFSAFWEKSEQWHGGSVTAWLFSIAQHAAIKIRIHHSRKKRSGEMVYIDAIGDDGEAYQLAEPRAAYHAVVEQECEIEIDRALLELKPTWRLAWILHYREGYTFREVATIMGGVSKAAAHLWASQANKFMRQRLWVFYEDLAGDGDPHTIEQRAAFRGLFTN